MRKIFKVVLLALLAAMFIGTFVFLWMKSRPKETVFTVVTPVVGSIEKKTVATGKVEPRDEVLIKPQINGIVSEVKKIAGEKIRQGEVIAVVKVIPDMVQLNSAESRVRVAGISLEQAETEYNRVKKLFDSGVVAKEEYDKTAAAYKKAIEEKDNAQDNLSIVKEGISKKSAQFSNTQIRATIDGMILDIPIKVGNSVIMSNNFNDGTTIASIADMSKMIFKGNVDETEVGRIHEGMALSLTIGALQDIKIPALLEYLSPKGVETNGAVLFEIKAAASIPDSVFIRAGYSANAEIILDRSENVLTIPEGSVTFSGDSSFVYILKKEEPKQEFEKQQVVLGLSDGINIEIKSGLTANDKIRGKQKTEEELKITASK